MAPRIVLPRDVALRLAALEDRVSRLESGRPPPGDGRTTHLAARAEVARCAGCGLPLRRRLGRCAECERPLDAIRRASPRPRQRAGRRARV